MGTDKALLPHPDGDTLLDHAVSLARALSGRVVLLSGNPPRYGDRHLPELADALPGGGPLGALCAALGDSAPLPALVLPVDLPYLAAAHLRRLLDEFVAGDASCVIAAGDDGLHPALGIWGPACLRPVERAVHERAFKLQSLALELHASQVHLPARALRNWNLPGDAAES